MSEPRPIKMAKGLAHLFEPRGAGISTRTRRIHAKFEVAYTAVDFSAALAFIVGSVMFFFAAWQTAGTWAFLIGSVLFAVKPSLRLVKELILMGEGRDDDVASRSPEWPPN